jgi:hypothetical protein
MSPELEGYIVIDGLESHPVIWVADLESELAVVDDFAL